MCKRIAVLITVSLLLGLSASAAVFRVDKDSPGPTRDGLTWATAFTTIQAGIDAAYSDGGGEVWVAEGTYSEQRTQQWGQPSNVEGSLIMKDNVAVYGGFTGYSTDAQEGNETLRTQRIIYNATTNRCRTVINGANSNVGAPAYHVVVIGKAAGPSPGVVLDGFGITGGGQPATYGDNGDYHTWRGAGIFIFRSSPIIENCMIYGNIASVSGGGIACESFGGDSADAIITNCIFWGNTAERLADNTINPGGIRGGGGIFANAANPTITNCTFYENVIGNLTFPPDPEPFSTKQDWGLRSEAVFAYDSTGTFLNDILYATAEQRIRATSATFVELSVPVTYSDIKNWSAGGTGNIAADPLFVNPVGGNFRTSAGSPVQNTAHPSSYPAKDLRGTTRPLNGGADMGAIEYDVTVPLAACVDPGVTLVNGAGSTTAAAVGGTSADAGGIAKMRLSDTSFDCVDFANYLDNPNAITTTLTVTDYAGNTSTCIATLTINGGNPYFESSDPSPLTQSVYAVNGNDPVISVSACGGGSSRTFTWYWDADGVAGGSVALTNGAAHPATAITITNVTTVGLDSSLTLTNPRVPAAGWYFCRLSDGVGPAVDTNMAQVRIANQVSVSGVTFTETYGTANDGTIRTAGNVAMRVTATGGFGTLTYQWKRNGSNVQPDGTVVRTMYPTINGGGWQVPVSTTWATTSIGGSSDLSITTALVNNGEGTLFDGGAYTCVVTDSTGPVMTGQTATSASGTLTIEDKITIVQDPVGGAQKYAGESQVFTCTAIGGSGPAPNWPPTGYNFIWQKNGGSPGGTSVRNGCTSTLTVNPLVYDGLAQTDFLCYAYDTTGTGNEVDTSLPAFITIKNPVTVAAPTVLTNLGTNHGNVGGSATITAVPSGGYTPYTTVSWQFDDGSGGGYSTISNGGGITGADTLTLTINPLAVIHEGSYRCIVTDSTSPPRAGFSTGTSVGSALSVTQLLAVGATSVVATPSGQPAVYVGEAFTLGVTATGGDGAYTYDWARNGTSLGAPDSAQYAVASATTGNAGSYTCVVDDGTPDPEVTSAALAFSVYTTPAITQDPVGATRNVGEDITFTAAATGGWGNLSYQWTLNTVPLVNDGRISGAQSSQLVINPLTIGDAGDYVCVVVDEGPAPTGPLSDTSAAATLVITNHLVIGSAGQPDDADVYENDTIILNVTVSGGTLPYTYQWFLDANNDGVLDSGEEVSGARVSGATTDTLTISTAEAGDASDLYRVWVGDSSGGVNDPTVSETASVTVSAPLAIDSEPANLAVYAGEAAQFAVVTSGGITPVVYSWEVDEGSGWNATGETEAALTIDPTDMSQDGFQYRCVVQAAVSDDPSSAVATQLTSVVATLTVATPIDLIGPDDARAYVGTTPDPAFDLAVTVLGGLNADEYEWNRRTGADPFTLVDSGTFSGNSVVLTVDPAVESVGLYEYQANVIDDVRTNGTDIATVEFDTHLTITGQPQDEIAKVGDVAEFTVGVSGGLGNVSFQWQKDDGTKAWVPVGTDSPTFTIDPVADEDAGSYRVVVTDEGSTVSAEVGMVESNVVTLEIGTGVPVTGGIGLALLTAFSALGGAMAIRRKK